MTVLCVNPNPAVDRVAVVHFRRGGTLRPLRSFEWPGGSGVHAAHVARQLGSKVDVLAVLGGDYGRRFIQLAEKNQLNIHAIWNSAETRGTYTLIDAEQGNICDIAEFGGEADPGIAEALLNAFGSEIRKHNVAILSGSLLPSLPVDLYQRMAILAESSGVPVIIDATGEALLSATRVPVFMIKASLEELSRDGVLDANIETAAVLDGIAQWIRSGVKNVCVSLGSSGVLWVSAEGMKLIHADQTQPFNTVGCGDSLVGAVAAELDRGLQLEQALVSGVAAATANLAYAEPGNCTPDDVRRLRQSVKVELGTMENVDRAISTSRPK